MTPRGPRGQFSQALHSPHRNEHLGDKDDDELPPSQRQRLSSPSLVPNTHPVCLPRVIALPSLTLPPDSPSKRCRKGKE